MQLSGKKVACPTLRVRARHFFSVFGFVMLVIFKVLRADVVFWKGGRRTSFFMLL